MDIKLFANKALLGLKKSSPTIALAAGIGTGIFATYLACKATLKVDAILEEAKAKVDDIHRVSEDPAFKQDHPELAASYTEENKVRDLVTVYGQTVWKLTKLYGPAIIAGGTSICLIVGSHRIMMKRAAALGATVTVLSESLKRYRAQIKEIYGEEKERDIYYGLSNEKITETVTNEQTGEETKQKVTVKAADVNKLISPYAVFFDESNPNYIKGDFIYNKDFISNVQLELNRKLQNRGWLFLNEARMLLGYKPIPEGQVMGWIWDDKKDFQLFDPDNPKIDLGINHIGRQDVRDFHNGYEKVFVINFDGIEPIIETFHLFDRGNRIA